MVSRRRCCLVFKNDNGHMITHSFLPATEEYELVNMTVPYATQFERIHIIRALLWEIFPGGVISRHSDINWPPRSCDLKPLDIFLWSYVKNRVYADKPLILAHLKTKIRQVAEISPNMCQKVIENYFKRINACNTSRGCNLNNVWFHT